MIDKKHALNDCLCGGTATRQSNRTPRWYRYGCQQCRRSGVEAETRDLAIADWNRQTAAPDLLEVCKIANRRDIRGEELTEAEADQLNAAIIKAEPMYI